MYRFCNQPKANAKNLAFTTKTTAKYFSFVVKTKAKDFHTVRNDTSRSRTNMTALNSVYPSKAISYGMEKQSMHEFILISILTVYLVSFLS